MNILMMAVNDPAGTAIQFCKAVNAYTPHRARLVTLETRYTHSWEEDIFLPRLPAERLGEVEELLKNADLFHFHMTADENLRLGPFLPADYLRGKLILHHHHGHPDYRGNPGKYIEKYQRLGRRNILVSTPDLMKLFPMARWQPNLVPIHEPLLLPLSAEERAGRPDRPLRIAHSPTRKDLKNTDDLLAVVAEEQSAGLALALDLMDDVPNVECLRRKRLCHVLFDHMQGYYGVSSLEGLSQGLAVIAGLDEWNTARIREFAGAEALPWVVARNREELRAALRELAGDPERTAAIGAASRAFMEGCWSDRKAALHLAWAYEHAV